MRRDVGAAADGFTLLEVIVSLAVIGIVMASATVFFTGALRANHRQSGHQTAIRFAVDGVERARMLRGAAVVAGRTPCTSGTSCPDPAAYGVASVVGAAWAGRFDSGDSSARLALPTAPDRQLVDAVTYERRFWVRQCWAAHTGGGACADTRTTAATAPFYRVVVAVTWADSSCAAGRCVHSVSTLLTGSLTDPVFRS